MPISISNKPQFTGIIILFIGVALLAFTFINAYLFLQEPFSIIASGDLAMVFGEALAPLIQACIRLMYLGIMGWIGSLLTVRGIPLLKHKHIPATSHIPVKKTQPQTSLPSMKQPSPTPPSAPTPKLQSTQQQPQNQSPEERPPKLASELKEEEPKAVLIPPENQREA